MNWSEKHIKQLEKAGLISGYTVSGSTTQEKKKSKYGNKKVVVDGFLFDSKKEANRYFLLKVDQLAGNIKNLRMQVEYKFEVNGNKVASYFADFVYEVVKTGETVVEDVKSKATRRLPVYRLKNKLMKAIHGITIKET